MCVGWCLWLGVVLCVCFVWLGGFCYVVSDSLCGVGAGCAGVCV